MSEGEPWIRSLPLWLSRMMLVSTGVDHLCRLEQSLFLCSEPRAKVPPRSGARADALDNSNVQPAENRYTKDENALKTDWARLEESSR